MEGKRGNANCAYLGNKRDMGNVVHPVSKRGTNKGREETWAPS